MVVANDTRSTSRTPSTTSSSTWFSGWAGRSGYLLLPPEPDVNAYFGRRYSYIHHRHVLRARRARLFLEHDDHARLSLSVGILIDDAIVSSRTSSGTWKRGGIAPTPRSLPLGDWSRVMATTFSIVAVFVPVAFMEGIIGRFFYQFGITVAFAVLISLFVSFTLTPMLSSQFLAMPGGHGRVFKTIEDGSPVSTELPDPPRLVASASTDGRGERGEPSGSKPLPGPVHR